MRSFSGLLDGNVIHVLEATRHFVISRSARFTVRSLLWLLHLTHTTHTSFSVLQSVVVLLDCTGDFMPFVTVGPLCCGLFTLRKQEENKESLVKTSFHSGVVQ